MEDLIKAIRRSDNLYDYFTDYDHERIEIGFCYDNVIDMLGVLNIRNLVVLEDLGDSKKVSFDGDLIFVIPGIDKASGKINVTCSIPSDYSSDLEVLEVDYDLSNVEEII